MIIDPIRMMVSFLSDLSVQTATGRVTSSRARLRTAMPYPERAVLPFMIMKISIVVRVPPLNGTVVTKHPSIQKEAETLRLNSVNGQ